MCVKGLAQCLPQTRDSLFIRVCYCIIIIRIRVGHLPVSGADRMFPLTGLGEGARTSCQLELPLPGEVGGTGLRLSGRGCRRVEPGG